MAETLNKYKAARIFSYVGEYSDKFGFLTGILIPLTQDQYRDYIERKNLSYRFTDAISDIIWTSGTIAASSLTEGAIGGPAGVAAAFLVNVGINVADSMIGDLEGSKPSEMFKFWIRDMVENQEKRFENKKF